MRVETDEHSSVWAFERSKLLEEIGDLQASLAERDARQAICEQRLAAALAAVQQAQQIAGADKDCGLGGGGGRGCQGGGQAN